MTGSDLSRSAEAALLAGATAGFTVGAAQLLSIGGGLHFLVIAAAFGAVLAGPPALLCGLGVRALFRWWGFGRGPAWAWAAVGGTVGAAFVAAMDAADGGMTAAAYAHCALAGAAAALVFRARAAPSS